MSPGKIAAQAGHAYLDAYLEALRLRPDTIPEYKERHGIKIAMTAKNLRQLERAHEEAKQAGLPCALITDLGYYGCSEELLGRSTVTALGIGPARRGEVEQILKRFQLMR